jgi:hypothetical protein
MAVGSIVARILTQYSDKGSKAASKDIMKLGKSFDDFSKKVGKAFLIAGAASAAFAVKLGVDSVKAAIRAQGEQQRLNQILLTTNGATAEQVKILNAQAEALEKVGVVSAGNISVVQSQLATFDLQFSSIQALTPAILDYVTAEKGATASAGEFKTMTNGLAQALNGQFGALTRAGFVLDEQTKKLISNGTEAERSAAIVKVLDSTYKGFNKELLKTPEGAIIALQNSFENIKTTIGNALLPSLIQFVNILQNKIIPQFEVFIAQNKDKLAQAFATAAQFALQFLTVAMAFSTWVLNNTTTVKTLAGFIAGMFIVSGVANFLTTLAAITAAYRVLAATATGAAIASAFATGGISAYAGLAGVAVVTAALTANAVKGGGGSTPSTSKPTLNGYLGSMPVGSAIAQTPSIGATKTTDTLAAFLAALNKNTTATVKNTKSVMDQATESAMKQLAARQAALSGSASIAIGGSGAKAFSTRNSNGGMNVVVNGVIGSPDEVVRVVQDGIANSSRRNGRSGGGGRMAPLVL